MSLTPAQQKLQELTESYTNHLLEVNDVAKEVVESKEIKVTKQGVMIPKDVWDRLTTVTNLAS